MTEPRLQAARHHQPDLLTVSWQAICDMIEIMWLLLIFYVPLAVLIGFSVFNGARLENLSLRLQHFAVSWLPGQRRKRRFASGNPLPSLPRGQGFVSTPQTEDEYRMFFLHELEVSLDMQLAFTPAGEVKLTNRQRRAVEQYIEYRDLPYRNAEQAFSDIGLRLI